MPAPILQASSSASGAGGGTTSGINTTDCDLFVIVVGFYSASPITSVSDSKGNSWSSLTLYNSSAYAIRIYYCKPTSVDTSHTFTVSGTTIYASFGVLAFKNTAQSSVVDVENGTGTIATGSSRQPGSVTPSQNNSLIITGIVYDGINSFSIDSSFTVEQQLSYIGGTRMGFGVAYLIQSTAAAVNPTWSWTGSYSTNANIAVFKPLPDFLSSWARGSNQMVI